MAEPTVEEDLARLPVLADTIDRTKAEWDAALAERLVIFRRLTEQRGVTQAVAGQAARLSSSGVSVVLHQAKVREAKARAAAEPKAS